jgi:tetratricopeptide (TPR) repeat protein
MLLTSVKLFSQVWRDSLNAAREAYKVEDYSKALQFYKSAQNNAPKELDFSEEIGQCAYKSKQFEVAEKTYNGSSSKKGNKMNRSKLFHNIGNSQMQQKNYQGAIDSYKKSLRNNPTDEETRYNLSEAIRRLKKEQDKKDNKKDKNDHNKNQPPPQNDKKEDQKNNSKNPNMKEGEGKDQENKISKKMMDKILDKLAKDESETKKKVASAKENKGETTSGKDW